MTLMKILLVIISVLFAFTASALAQISVATQIQILKAEDSRDFNKTLQTLLKSEDASVRTRAALAAGRIGDDAAIEALIELLDGNQPVEVREMAAFALGEIESVKASSAILGLLNNANLNNRIRARAIEAAGKIAAANAKDASSKQLGDAILNTLKFEEERAEKQDKLIVLLGLTAALRTRPEGADVIVAKFLNNPEPRVRSDAANTLSRLRAKNANAELREMLLDDKDAVARANAANALGSAGANDKDTLDLLLVSAIEDTDERVRISAIRSLGRLKDASAAEALLKRGESLLAKVQKTATSNDPEMNEILEIATAIGSILKDSKNERAVNWLKACRAEDNYRSSEFAVALARIAPAAYVAENVIIRVYSDPWAAVAYAQGLDVLADEKDEEIKLDAAIKLTSFVGNMAKKTSPANQGKMLMAMPDLIRSLAKFKPDNLDAILRSLLSNDDVFIRAAASELIGELPYSNENMAALKKASSKAFITDNKYDDAQLAAIDAAFKLDKKKSVGILLTALNSPDYLVRRKAFELLKEVDTKESPGVPTLVEDAKEKGKDKVLPGPIIYGTMLGQVLNSDADYRRVASRKNGKVKAVIATEKGTFTIDLLPEDAPLTVDNFIKLASAKYFDGLAVHRVVPNFVMQDGDPRGDGNGGPGWSIRCEINMVPYERGAVGMALSGKDTGGSQWFATHSPQPHLDGGYTVFGRVNEADMKVVDKIVRGDKILTVKIIGSNSRNPRRKQ